MYETILVEKLESGIGLIRLNRPQAMNALNSTLMRELMAALKENDADSTIGCHVITGNEKAFAAGADIKEMAANTAVSMLVGDPISAWDELKKIRKPVIAAVGGVCLGGGCELAMTCDMIIAAENARFGQPEINLGVIPGAGGTQRLTRAVGKAIAMEMVLNNRWLTAQEAAHFGLVNHVHPVEVYLDETLKIAAEIAGRAPVAIRLAKECVNKSYEMTLNEGLEYERRSFHFLFSTDDQAEGMDAFVNKRPADWKGQ
ncbi:MAG: enoyl-CoA hydratase/isomerase family protein [Anaerolineae bacterium]|jgi:enoyl-CoA hydratase|nr:enoyl-CoA hydratase/isomerase family protein [Anaerolineae bacterium]